jgi:hypothetical protein
MTTTQSMQSVPIRVDFAGGWLDVPALARPGAYIVNCTFSPFVSLAEWPYEQPGAGIGGSAAWRILRGENGIDAELAAGAGWQDPAVIMETGLCVWRSGPRPALELKANPDWLQGLCALLWTGRRQQPTPDFVLRERGYYEIEVAAMQAKCAVAEHNYRMLACAVRASHYVQNHEGMLPLKTLPGDLAKKYCGAGWGGYAVYLFETRDDRERACRDRPAMIRIEPYMRELAT